jgi:carbonic anhydrase/acetyltransferase-like protein (isoleucine patch superfamily)
MPVIWTDPRTWVDGETPTGGQFNTHIRDNLKFLKETPSFDGAMNVTGDVSASGKVNVGDDLAVADDAVISGDLHVVGNTQLDGNVIVGDAPADIVQIKATVVGAPLKTYTETRTDPVIAAGALLLDCALGTYFKVPLNANVTITIANPPAAGRALGITIIFIADGTARAITWPPSVVWPSAIAPTMSFANGKRDLVTLITEDGGTTWFGVLVGQLY